MAEWLKRQRGIVLFAVIAVTLTSVVLLQFVRRQPPPILISTALPPASPEPTATPRPLRVYVSGAVQHPDVYILRPDSIVKDALVAAGGPTGDADLDRINLAQAVQDGQQIHVPRRGEEDPPAMATFGQRMAEAKVNINTADAAALETLPGVGPVTAERIIEYRQAHGPFAAVEEIQDVSGIGPATFERLKDHITTN